MCPRENATASISQKICEDFRNNFSLNGVLTVGQPTGGLTLCVMGPKSTPGLGWTSNPCLLSAFLMSVRTVVSLLTE